MEMKVEKEERGEERKKKEDGRNKETNKQRRNKQTMKQTNKQGVRVRTLYLTHCWLTHCWLRNAFKPPTQPDALSGSFSPHDSPPNSIGRNS